MILPDLIHFAWLALAVLLEIAANILLKFSNGFKKILPGMLSLACVLLAFSALSQAVNGIDLSVAYALWGGFWYRRDRGSRVDTVWSAAQPQGLGGAGAVIAGHGHFETGLITGGR